MIVIAVSLVLGNLLEQGGISWTGALGLSTTSFLSGHLYQLLTYIIPVHGLMDGLFNALLFWFLGSELETMWGPKRYLCFLLAVTLGGGLIFILGGGMLGGSSARLLLSGAGGIANALCLAYGILYPNRIFTFMFIFPMKAKHFCLLLVGIQCYQAIFSGGFLLAVGQLAAMGCGLGFMLVVSSPKYLKLQEEKKKRAPKRKGKGKLSLVSSEEKKDDDSGPPKYWQ